MKKSEAWSLATPSTAKAFVKPKAKAKPAPKNDNFLQKLFIRETCGKFKSGVATHEPKVRPFSRLPGRLAFCLRDVVPMSALEAGHIFLGFSKCGQFLLSYTQTPAENLDLTNEIWRIPYHYRLHWWLFTPYKKAKKVSEVMLFTNTGTDAHIHLSFCQWAKDNNMVLVYGYLKSKHDIRESFGDYSKPCYLTVTAVPALNGCQECIQVAANYDEEEMAAAWNSCARLSCLEHGFTVHTTFDLVMPYPRFEPRISLKCDSSVVINTGNVLHCLSFDLERAKNSSNSSSSSTSKPITFPSRVPSLFEHQEQQNQNNMHLFRSPPHAPSVTSDSDCESDPFPSISRRSRLSGIHQRSERFQRVAEFAESLSPPNSGLRSMIAWHGIRRVEDSKKRMADKVYEMSDENFEIDALNEKISTFRRKRLAEKKYAFTDDTTENITPLSQLRKQSSNQSDQDQPQPSTSNVLRPLSANTELSDFFEVPELLSPGGMVKKDHSFMASPRSTSELNAQQGPSSSSQIPRFHAKFTRKFIELDEEAISVMTEIEDDDLGVTLTGYLHVLPLEVHGSAYQPMAMISNSKAEKLLGKRCLKIGQTSLDVELLCHDMAQKLCCAAGKKYWFCNDYDVEIIDVDPDSMQCVCVAVVQVQATVVTSSTKKVSNDENYSYSALQRLLYTGGFKFCWDLNSGQYYVIDSEPLQEIFKAPPGPWNPAKGIAMSYQKKLGCVASGSNIRCHTNDSVINDTSLKTIVDSENFVAIILDDLLNDGYSSQ